MSSFLVRLGKFKRNAEFSANRTNPVNFEQKREILRDSETRKSEFIKSDRLLNYRAYTKVWNYKLY